MKGDTAANTRLRHSALLVFISLLWGVAFVAQSAGSDYITPYTFCSLRYLMGAAVLAPIIPLLDRIGVAHGAPKTPQARKRQWLGGAVCGIFLASASLCQQMGITLGVASGKAGFLTACYIVLVPVLGLFFRRRCGLRVWIAVAITVCGLYLLCMNGSFSLQGRDAVVLFCSLLYAMQIMSIDHFVATVDAVRLACIQFLTAGVVLAVPMALLEMRGGLTAWCAMFTHAGGWVALLYTGILSTAVAYTGQCVGQQGVPPALASLLMSFESVFSVLAGWLILGEQLSLR